MATQQFIDSNVIKGNAQNVAAFNAWLAAHSAAYDIPEGTTPNFDLVEAEVDAWDTWLALTEEASIASPGHQLGLFND
jgi:ABC-type glycerol-3-phosphate transport system substrate-binding protein